MPPEVRSQPGDHHHDGPAQTSPGDARPVQQFLSVPAPIKRIFDRFPLLTYPPNELPKRELSYPHRNRLFVFIDPTGARHGRPSFNPQCLRWQAYLKFVGIDFEIIPSNNHASPTGALPYLLPALPADQCLPIPSTRLEKWAIDQIHREEEQQVNTRFGVYTSLLDHRLRNAWLYHLYLNRDNFDAVARGLYINPSTSNSLVRAALAINLQRAARDELLKSTNYIDINDLEAEVGNAFEALSIILGTADFFFDRVRPGLFDANVFAYTHLLLDEEIGWKQNTLIRLLHKHKNLLQHRDRLLETYFRGD